MEILGDPIAQPYKGAYNLRWMHSLNWITSRSQSWKAWGMAFFVPNEFLNDLLERRLAFAALALN